MNNQENEQAREPDRLQGGIGSRILRIFTVVYPGEAPTVFLLMLNVYLLLAAYYIIKPVREALILAGKGAEWKSYLSAAIAVLLVFVVRIFSAIASKYPRQKLITAVTLFFISNLAIFYILSIIGVKLGTMGIIFFVWVGIFNVLVVAQFWGFANDLFSPEAGKRLFPLIAFGATFGGFTGSTISKWLVEPIGVYQMMLVAGGVLGICIVLTWIIHLRETKRFSVSIDRTGTDSKPQGGEQEKPLEKGGGFKLVFKKRYLLYIAIMVLLLNFINTNGEYILGEYVTRTAKEAVAAGTTGTMDVKEFIGEFYAGFYKWMNLFAMFVQLFLVSRIFKWFGVRAALFILPFISLGGYFLIAMGASLMLIKWVKVAENGTDYSLMNTARHALFLITSREEKYKAKAAIDTFFHRAGDVFSALLVFIGTTYFALRTERFALINVVLVLGMLTICFLIKKEHKKLTGGA